MVATAKGADSTRVSLDGLALTAGSPIFQDCGCASRERCRRYGHYGPAEYAPVSTPAQREGPNCVEAYLDRVHIEIAGPAPARSAGGKEYAYIVVDDHMRAVHMRPL